MSQLAHRVFGPLQLLRAQIVLNYHGLLGYPAGQLVEIADRHRVTTRTVSNDVAVVRARGARQPLSPPQITAAIRPSTPTDDHTGRVRIALTLRQNSPSTGRSRGSCHGSDPGTCRQHTPRFGYWLRPASLLPPSIDGRAVNRSAEEHTGSSGTAWSMGVWRSPGAAAAAPSECATASWWLDERQGARCTRRPRPGGGRPGEPAHGCTRGTQNQRTRRRTTPARQ